MNTNTYNISISKEKIAEMPVVTFSGDITVIDSLEKVEKALQDLCGHNIIGFDTETKPSFQKGRCNKPALMQLSTETHCYLFRLNKIGMPEGLIDLLINPEIIKVGLSVHDDFHMLHRMIDIEPKGFVDIQDFVHRFNISDISLQKVYAIVFGGRISKGQRLTNWEADNLTPSQQTYAAIDAWACLKLYNYLREGCFNPDSSPYKVPIEETAENDTNKG